MSKQLFLKQNLKPGEIYAGLILGKDGQPDYHLVLLPEEFSKELNWNCAMQWANSVGGDLPTRNEQSLLFVNCKTQFKPKWYWSNEQNANYTNYVWVQDFNDGCKNDDHKIEDYRARAIRRIYIED
jgi:hypothetical protein